MAKVIITDAGSLNGESPLELDSFTNRDLNIIKREAGVRAGEMQEAVRRGDNDLFVALAMIALRRAGREPLTSDALWDLDVGKIIIDVTEDDEGEAAAEAALPPPSGPDSPASETTTTDSGSRDSESTGGASQETGLRSVSGSQS